MINDLSKVNESFFYLCVIITIIIINTFVTITIIIIIMPLGDPLSLADYMK